MFVLNAVSELDLLNSWEGLLGAEKVSELKQGKGFSFFQLIFSRIKEGFTEKSNFFY